MADHEDDVTPDGREIFTVTALVRTDDPSAWEHITHLLANEGYDADVTTASEPKP